ncbi:MAG TPA: hypothetical protein VNU26_12670 [Mycobacteriales bacterium]|nr:hypothetical protein [Mycobacteriales bacterium]
MRVLRTAVVTAALAGGLGLVTAGPAAAAHCVEDDSPGFSYFGTGHASEDREAQGSKEGPHGGTSGASNCNETTGNPSERAPGQNR